MMKPFFYPVLAVACISAFAQEPAPKPADAAKTAEAPKLPEAFLKAKTAAERGDFATAVKILTEEAEKGNVDAMAAVADFYLMGRGVPASAENAAKWLSKGADAGHAQSQTTLATLLYNGAQGVKKDEERAKFLLHTAAESGFAPAQYQAGVLAEAAVDTKSREPNWKECREWFEKAAGQGHAEALLAMVRFYDRGLGAPENPEKGTESCIAAAKGGSVVAMNEMGVRYQRGTGIRADGVAAIGWFTLATQYGLPAAAINLGNCYETGNGVRQDFVRAGEQYAAAAKAGNAVAQLMIARLFEEGKGTPKNLTYAFVNYTRAAAGGIEGAAKKRDELKAKLSAAELKEAEGILAAKPGKPGDEPKKDAPKKKK